MLNPILKPSLDWKNVAKRALLASGSILIVHALLTSSGTDRTKQWFVGLWSAYGVSSVIGLLWQDRKISRLENSIQHTKQQLQDKEEQIAQIKTTIQQNYQQLESSLTEEKNQLVEAKKNLEQQLRQKQEEVAEIKTTIKQQKEACQKLEQEKKEAESLFTLENQEKEKLGQDKEELQQQNEQLKQDNFRLKQQITNFNQKSEKYQDKPNNIATYSSLSNLQIALVGGHPTACHQVKNKLEEKHNFKQIQLLPKQKNTPKKKTIKQQIKDADFIFIITGFNEHSVSKHVYNLQQAGQLQGNVIHISHCRGETGIYDYILKHIQSH